MKIYISGKITGLLPEVADKLFKDAERKLTLDGHEVVNPMTIPHDHDKTWLSYMRADIKALVDCDAIYMLRNWTESKGACTEFNLAHDLGLKIIEE